MDKNLRNRLIFIIFGVITIFPIIINILMSVSFFPKIIPVNGDYQVWVPTLGTFWGATIGGVISGVLTLLGVNKTIEASFQSLEESAKQLREAHEIELDISTTKERLKELYQPVESLHSEYIYRYAAHDFYELSYQEQLDYIFLLNKNIVYGDSILHEKLIELKWAHRDGNYPEANKLYNDINDLITDEIIILRKKLKLPRMFNDNNLPKIEDNYPTEMENNVHA